MRLTLRTMLAWKDGLLPPDVAADIEHQIRKSKSATFLLARAKYHSKAPPATPIMWLAAAGISEPDIADWFYNRLQKDRLFQFEKACLESETLLSHVCWRHQLWADAIETKKPPSQASDRDRSLDASRSEADNTHPEALPAFEHSLSEVLRSLETKVKTSSFDSLSDVGQIDEEPDLELTVETYAVQLENGVHNYLQRARIEAWWSFAARTTIVTGGFFIFAGVTFRDWWQIITGTVVFALLWLVLYLQSLAVDLPKDLQLVARLPIELYGVIAARSRSQRDS